MVYLHVKRGDESQFLLQAPGSTPIGELTQQVTKIYNGRLKVERICSEMEELAEHGIFLPPNMQGLTDEQIEELKLKDEWAEKCMPSGGSVFKKDEIGRRNGHAPDEKMMQVLKKTVEEAKALISKKQVQANVCVTMEMVKDALDQLRGAVMIVYPMGLPPYDPVRMEFENKEDLSGTQAGLQIINESEAQIWWAAKELKRTQKLSDYVGKNEKTKIIVKLQQKGQGAPAREPVISNEEQKQMMLYYYKRQEELKNKRPRNYLHDETKAKHVLDWEMDKLGRTSRKRLPRKREQHEQSPQPGEKSGEEKEVRTCLLQYLAWQSGHVERGRPGSESSCWHTPAGPGSELSADPRWAS